MDSFNSCRWVQKWLSCRYECNICHATRKERGRKQDEIHESRLQIASVVFAVTGVVSFRAAQLSSFQALCQTCWTQCQHYNYPWVLSSSPSFVLFSFWIPPFLPVSLTSPCPPPLPPCGGSVTKVKKHCGNIPAPFVFWLFHFLLLA